MSVIRMSPDQPTTWSSAIGSALLGVVRRALQGETLPHTRAAKILGMIPSSVGGSLSSYVGRLSHPMKSMFDPFPCCLSYELARFDNLIRRFLPRHLVLSSTEKIHLS
jgi:hypothetical protein